MSTTILITIHKSFFEHSSHLNFSLCCRSIRNPHVWCIPDCCMHAALAKNLIAVDKYIMHFQMNIYSAAVTLFLVMDPLGNIPVFLSLLKQVDPSRRTKIILRESLIAFAILTLFLFCGKPILASLHISEEALGIAGGIILFLIAIRMLFPMGQKIAEQTQGEPFIVPMAIPLLAGPSSMTTVILFASQAPHQMGKWFTALAAASLIATLLLLIAVPLQKLLGVKVIVALERLMGMILTTIAVQMFLTGLGTYLSSLG